MKNCLLATAAVALIGLVGCTGGTTGGPGADKAKKEESESKVKKALDKLHQPENTFSLSVPVLATKLKQGEVREVTVGIKRGKNIDQDVALKLDGLPTGVTAEPSAPTIKTSETEATFKLKAAQDASVGDFTVKVIGHPTKGDEATNKFKLTVVKK